MSLPDTAEYWQDIKSYFQTSHKIHWKEGKLHLALDHKPACGAPTHRITKSKSKITCIACLNSLKDHPSYCKKCFFKQSCEDCLARHSVHLGFCNSAKTPKDLSTYLKSQYRCLECWQAFVPNCPSCTIKMKLRTSKYGLFWGCANYPKCKGTRKLLLYKITHDNQIFSLHSNSTEMINAILALPQVDGYEPNLKLSVMDYNV